MEPGFQYDSHDAATGRPVPCLSLTCSIAVGRDGLPASTRGMIQLAFLRMSKVATKNRLGHPFFYCSRRLETQSMPASPPSSKSSYLSNGQSIWGNHLARTHFRP